MALVLPLLVATVYWVEAEKEARVLCGLATVSTPESEVQRMFGTATLLRVEATVEGTTRELRAASPMNLGLSGCTVTMTDGAVSATVAWEHFRSSGAASLVLLVGLPITAVSSFRAIAAARRRGKDGGPAPARNRLRVLATRVGLTLIAMATLVLLLGAPS
ncbi:MAG: hypothetical protein KF709_10125 [Gemmatimonadaceae bacterium]|nr:hypothetical protein [Gemmatimonadaceae bacterium]